MDVRLKLNLILGAVFIVALAFTEFYVNDSLHQAALQKTKENAQRQMNTALAVRKYTTDYVREHLLLDPDEFHEASVPSFSAIKTMQNLEKSYPGYNYREVALNPTNLRDKAQGWQIDKIKTFQKDRTKSELFYTTKEGEEEYLYYLKPLIVSAESCLQCHSTPDVAPPNMIVKYGDKNGFGWKLGDVIGAQIVSVPTSISLEEAHSAFLTYLISISAIFAAFFVLLNLVLNRIIIRPLQKMQGLFDTLTNHDYLTGILNRRGFESRLIELVGESHLRQAPLSLICIDIDNFKAVNDKFGYNAGDNTLKELVGRLREHIKDTVILGRIGGDEFALILPRSKADKALELAERLREAVADIPFEEVGTITASLSVTGLKRDVTWQLLMENADRAMFKAKESGTNRVENV